MDGKFESLKSEIGSNVALSSDAGDAVEKISYLIKNVEAQVLEHEGKLSEKLEVIVDSLTAILDSVSMLSNQFKTLAHLEGRVDFTEAKKLEELFSSVTSSMNGISEKLRESISKQPDLSTLPSIQQFEEKFSEMQQEFSNFSSTIRSAYSEVLDARLNSLQSSLVEKIESAVSGFKESIPSQAAAPGEDFALKLPQLEEKLNSMLSEKIASLQQELLSKFPATGERQDDFQPLFERFESISSQLNGLKEKLGEPRNSFTSPGGSDAQMASGEVLKRLDSLGGLLGQYVEKQSEELAAFAEGIVFSNEQLAELPEKISGGNASDLLKELKELKALVSKQGEDLGALASTVADISEELVELKSPANSKQSKKRSEKEE